MKERRPPGLQIQGCNETTMKDRKQMTERCAESRSCMHSSTLACMLCAEAICAVWKTRKWMPLK